MSISPARLTFRRLGAVAALLLLFLLPATPRTQEIDQIEQTVARVSYVSGPVSYNRGDDPEEWETATTNVPFTIGDRIYSSADGRAELQLSAGNFIRLASRTYLRALNLTYDTKQFYVGEGAASFNIRRLDRDETIEVDTPNIAVTLDGPGNYRVEVDEEGNSRVVVRRGRAIVAANGREVTVEDSEIRVDGVDPPRYEIFALGRPDAFDRWADERDDRFERAYRGAYDYVSDEVIGAEELRDYGRWEQIPDYGYAWTPERVPVGWQPYTVGQWFWQDPWGWSWLSHEPWGWATCHYGRWAHHRGRWYWVPVGKRVRFVRYAPAHVVFVPVRGHIGWFPLHPRDRFVPWWSRRGSAEHTTYVHRARVVIVERDTFVSARKVTTRIVRDMAIVNEVNSARLMEHQLPIPRRSSLRVAEERESHSGQRPPAKLLSRPAVVRSAPPPPPPTFHEKLVEIEKNQGAPIAPDTALALGLRSKADNRMLIRPVAVEAERANFAPRASAGSTPPTQPLSAARGKRLATRDEPFLTSLPKTTDRAERRPSQEEGGAAAPESSKGSAGLTEPQQERQRQEREEERRRELERQREQERERQRRERALLERQQQLERERQRQAKQLQEQQRQEQALRQQQERELERRQKEVERDRQQQERLLQEQQHKEQQLRQQQQQVQKEPQPRKEQKRNGQKRRDDEQRKKAGAKPPP